MNIPEDADITDMVLDGSEVEKGVLWKLHNELDTTCPHEYWGLFKSDEYTRCVSL